MLPRSALTNGGWQTTLIDKGLRIGDEQTLKQLLLNVAPNRLFDVVEHAGWNGSLFVLPSGETFGAVEVKMNAFCLADRNHLSIKLQ